MYGKERLMRETIYLWKRSQNENRRPRLRLIGFDIPEKIPTNRHIIRILTSDRTMLRSSEVYFSRLRLKSQRAYLDTWCLNTWQCQPRHANYLRCVGFPHNEERAVSRGWNTGAFLSSLAARRLVKYQRTFASGIRFSFLSPQKIHSARIKIPSITKSTLAVYM